MVPGSPSRASIRNFMCPDVKSTYSCICACSERRNAVSRSTRSQKAPLNSAATSCQFLPSGAMAIGAGDSSDSSLIALSMRPRLRFTRYINS